MNTTNTTAELEANGYSEYLDETREEPSEAEVAEMEAETLADKCQLPEVSRRVYLALVASQDPGEPAYSCTDAAELAALTGLAVNEVKGALGHLVKVGLVWMERTSVNRARYEFAHAFNLKGGLLQPK